MIVRKLIKTAILFAVLMLTGCNSELVSQLTERQANEIIALLHSHNIDADKTASGKGKFAVKVDDEYMDEATELLAAYNLPSAEDIEIAQQFPADAMVSTPLGEKARLISAIEQRLGQTLQALSSVTSARIHLSYPVNIKDDEQSAPVASVLIIYRGTIDEAEYTDKIKRFIKNSVQNILYENISVVLFKEVESPRLTKVKDNGLPLNNLLVLILTGILLATGIFLFAFRNSLPWRNKRRADKKDPEPTSETPPSP